MTTDTVTTAQAATPKQVSFIKSLLKERGLAPEVNAALTKTAASALISTLLATPKVAKAAPAPNPYAGLTWAEVLEANEYFDGEPEVTEAAHAKWLAANAAHTTFASEKQVAFIVKLYGERHPEATEAALQSVKDLAPKLSKVDASKRIKELLALPKPIAAKPVVVKPAYVPVEHDPYLAVAKKGDVHVIDGTYYRLHQYQSSKKLYAARAVIYGKAVWSEDGTKLLRPGTVKWVTAKGKIYELSEDTKATAIESASFGKMLGRCVYCSLKIDTPESVSVGYGPVCAETHKLPWGATA